MFYVLFSCDFWDFVCLRWHHYFTIAKKMSTTKFTFTFPAELRSLFQPSIHIRRGAAINDWSDRHRLGASHLVVVISSDIETKHYRFNSHQVDEKQLQQELHIHEPDSTPRFKNHNVVTDTQWRYEFARDVITSLFRKFKSTLFGGAVRDLIRYHRVVDVMNSQVAESTDVSSKACSEPFSTIHFPREMSLLSSQQIQAAAYLRLPRDWDVWCTDAQQQDLAVQFLKDKYDGCRVHEKSDYHPEYRVISVHIPWDGYYVPGRCGIRGDLRGEAAFFCMKLDLVSHKSECASQGPISDLDVNSLCLTEWNIEKVSVAPFFVNTGELKLEQVIRNCVEARSKIVCDTEHVFQRAFTRMWCKLCIGWTISDVHLSNLYRPTIAYDSITEKEELPMEDGNIFSYLKTKEVEGSEHVKILCYGADSIHKTDLLNKSCCMGDEACTIRFTIESLKEEENKIFEDRNPRNLVVCVNPEADSDSRRFAHLSCFWKI